MFTQELVQLVSDWQRDLRPERRTVVGERLKVLSKELPDRFRTCGLVCYRQEAHDQSRTWKLIAERNLPERIASWTTSIEVAKTFKGGVPADDTGVIFAVKPSEGEVVLNLDAMFRDDDFRKFVSEIAPKIDHYYSGIGRWSGNQHEVILEVGTLPREAILHYGRYSSDAETLAGDLFGHPPSAEELAQFMKWWKCLQ